MSDQRRAIKVDGLVAHEIVEPAPEIDESVACLHVVRWIEGPVEWTCRCMLCGCVRRLPDTAVRRCTNKTMLDALIVGAFGPCKETY